MSKIKVMILSVSLLVVSQNTLAQDANIRISKNSPLMMQIDDINTKRSQSEERLKTVQIKLDQYDRPGASHAGYESTKFARDREKWALESLNSSADYGPMIDLETMAGFLSEQTHIGHCKIKSVAVSTDKFLEFTLNSRNGREILFRFRGIQFEKYSDIFHRGGSFTLKAEDDIDENTYLPFTYIMKMSLIKKQGSNEDFQLIGFEARGKLVANLASDKAPKREFFNNYLPILVDAPAYKLGSSVNLISCFPL